jgi:hypothetical protein
VCSLSTSLGGDLMPYGTFAYGTVAYGVSPTVSTPVIQGWATVFLMACGARVTLYASEANVTVQAPLASVTLS